MVTSTFSGSLAPTTRFTEADIDPLFVERWSPRAFLPAPLAPQLVQSLFEAARWAPSASNLQPWLFVYADDAATLEPARGLLKEANRRWAERAPLLVFAFARRINPKTDKPNRLALFDAGAACMSLILQARKLGLHSRSMGGIEHEQVYDVLGVPQGEFESLCAIAVGQRAPRDDLPEDLRERETPSGRSSTREFVFRGAYSRT